MGTVLKIDADTYYRYDADPLTFRDIYLNAMRAGAPIACYSESVFTFNDPQSGHPREHRSRQEIYVPPHAILSFWGT